MKRLITNATVFALLTIGTSAFAQQGDKGKDNKRQGQQQDRGERRGGGQGQKGAGRVGQGGGGGGLFRLLDIDRDGNLSAKEIDGAVAVLRKLDANKNGVLDAQELTVRGEGGQGRNRGGQRGAENPKRRRGGQGTGGKGNRSAENKGKSE